MVRSKGFLGDFSCLYGPVQGPSPGDTVVSYGQFLANPRSFAATSWLLIVNPLGCSKAESEPWSKESKASEAVHAPRGLGRFKNAQANPQHDPTVILLMSLVCSFPAALLVSFAASSVICCNQRQNMRGQKLQRGAVWRLST